MVEQTTRAGHLVTAEYTVEGDDVRLHFGQQFSFALSFRRTEAKFILWPVLLLLLFGRSIAVTGQ